MRLTLTGPWLLFFQVRQNAEGLGFSLFFGLPDAGFSGKLCMLPKPSAGALPVLPALLCAGIAGSLLSHPPALGPVTVLYQMPFSTPHIRFCKALPVLSLHTAQRTSRRTISVRHRFPDNTPDSRLCPLSAYPGHQRLIGSQSCCIFIPFFPFQMGCGSAFGFRNDIGCCFFLFSQNRQNG